MIPLFLLLLHYLSACMYLNTVTSTYYAYA